MKKHLYIYKALILQAFLYVTNKIHLNSQCHAPSLHLWKDQYFFSRTRLYIPTNYSVTKQWSFHSNWTDCTFWRKYFLFFPGSDPVLLEQLKFLNKQIYFFKDHVIKRWHSFPQGIVEAKSKAHLSLAHGARCSSVVSVSKSVVV